MTEYEQRCRKAVARLGAISHVMREKARVEEFVAALLRHERALLTEDVERGVDRLIDTAGKDVPVPSDLLGMAQLCRADRLMAEKRQERESEHPTGGRYAGAGKLRALLDGLVAKSKMPTEPEPNPEQRRRAREQMEQWPAGVVPVRAVPTGYNRCAACKGNFTAGILVKPEKGSHDVDLEPDSQGQFRVMGFDEEGRMVVSRGTGGEYRQHDCAAVIRAKETA